MGTTILYKKNKVKKKQKQSGVWPYPCCIPFNNSFLLVPEADPLPVAAVPAAVLVSKTPTEEEPP